ncbi:amino acid ABC transporter permease [Arsenicicoccus piscis]|uniref:ABC transporter permease n=1 Tax=Arsenicicoccus piscis TaxID=673954 RepID=A0ABQ6HWG4_9MICO|nr:amino acid ABC transporter permease [Arsenicicoccus piscis]GMA21874.1 ABC transporter permease [Arsenicicoccus piscis]
MGELLASYPVWGAIWMTIKLTILSGIGAMIVGTIVAVFRLSPVPMLQALGAFYVNVVRNTPLTLLMIFSSLGLVGIMNWNLSPNLYDNNFWWAVVMLSTYTGAFVCESIRAGVNTVPLGQAEAARSIGLGFGQSLRLVILPQAFRGAVVPLGNTMIAMCKNTTVASVIGVSEVSGMMKTMFEDRPDLLFWIILLVGLIFVVLTLPAGIAITNVGRRLAVKR